MAPRDTSQDPSEAPVPVEKGFATLATLRYVLDICLPLPAQPESRGSRTDWRRIGVKAFVEKVRLSLRFASTQNYMQFSFVSYQHLLQNIVVQWIFCRLHPEHTLTTALKKPLLFCHVLCIKGGFFIAELGGRGFCHGADVL